jgi:hypothetical protein
MIPLNFALFIIFLSIFLKLLGLQERFLKTSAGSWFQSWMVLFNVMSWKIVRKAKTVPGLN